MPSNNCYIVKNNENSYYKFNVDEYDNLIVKSNSNNSNDLIKKNVLNFSVDMDKKKRIFLLYLTNQGNLKLCNYPNLKQDTTLTNIDIKNNKIKYLNLILLNEDIHIFYLLCGNNNDLYTIYHTYYHNYNWTLNKAAVIEADKYMCPYTIIKHEKNLYLFHPYGNSKYCVKKFNYSNYIWNNIESNITLEEAHNTSFIINNKNIGIISYNKLVDKTLGVFIKYKDFNNSLSIWSKEIMLSNSNTNAVHPSIIVKNNTTYILWEEGNKIVFRKSLLGTDKWDDREILTTNDEIKFHSTYFNDNDENEYFKKTIVITEKEKYTFPLVSLDTFKEFIEKNTSQKQVSSGVKLDENKRSNSKNDPSSQVEMLNLALVNYSKNIENIKGEVQGLKEAVRSLQNKNSDTEHLIFQLQTSLSDKENENNKEIISKLTGIINSLHEENMMKAERIANLEKKISRKSLLNIFKK